MSVSVLQKNKNEVEYTNGGNNEFSSWPIKTRLCEDNDIRLDTSVSKEEHISNGNKLGIIDRFVRSLNNKHLIKYLKMTMNNK